MSDTVLVIGTINSLYGQFSPAIRFGQTMAAIDSAKAKIPGAKIVYVDNSNEPINAAWRKIIESKVDLFHQLEHNLFSDLANRRGSKSPSEANMLYMGMELLREQGLLGRRIFKLSGRYAITDEFDIKDYDRPELEGKYTFAANPCTLYDENMGFRRTVMFLEQDLMSWPSSLHDHLQSLLLGVLDHLINSNATIEETMFEFVPHHMIVPVKPGQAAGVDTTVPSFEPYRNIGAESNV